MSIKVDFKNVSIEVPQVILDKLLNDGMKKVFVRQYIMNVLAKMVETKLLKYHKLFEVKQ